jgi:hypothetical protein
MKNFALVFSLFVLTLAACNEKPKDGTGEIDFIDDEFSS